MAIVLALLITGWLLALAVGTQAGFENSSEPVQPAVKTAQPTATANYSNPASIA